MITQISPPPKPLTPTPAPHAKAESKCLSVTYNREYRSLEEDLAKLESITKDDLVAVAAANSFSPMTITTLGP